MTDRIPPPTNPLSTARRTPAVLAVSLLLAAGLLSVLALNTPAPRRPMGDPKVPLVVYTTDSVRPAIAEIARQFQEEVGVTVQLQAITGDALSAADQAAGGGDLYIPADESFLQQAREQGLVGEVIPFGKISLVIAVAPGNPKDIHKLDDLFRQDVAFALPSDDSACGKAAMKALRAINQWDQVKAFRRLEAPDAIDVALAVRAGMVDAGVVWDATARELGLDAIRPDQFVSAASIRSAGVLTRSKRPTEALRLARFLAAPTRGQLILAKHDHEGVPGDPWELEPKITLFAGTLNGAGVRQTIDEFRLREGVTIDVEYRGCDELTRRIKAGERPDAYFACDASYASEVADVFHEFRGVSKTRLVLLVHKANPMRIQSLADLTRDGVKVGIADADKSPLGSQTRRLLEAEGIDSRSLAAMRHDAPTADLLVAQLLDSGSLHAAVVYEASCAKVKERATVIPIDHPLAVTIQPVAASRETKYPQLTSRLMNAIAANKSRERFERAGFTWVWE